MSRRIRLGNREYEIMSTNCIRCVKNKRTDIDLLCDECRAAEAPERASRILLAPSHGSETGPDTDACFGGGGASA